MRVVTNTNIIVDDFGYCKSFPKNTFIHFLTHFHADHWDGMTPLWDYSPIYCTDITANLILNKFPKLQKLIIRCQYYKEYSILIGHGDLVVKFWLFDAKHIPGSAMILFEGYMGRILITGDFRYNFDMVLENEILFPQKIREGILSQNQNGNKKVSSFNDKAWVESQAGIAVHVDEVVFDNTYCNEMFDFGLEDDIFKKVVSIIDQNKGKKVLVTLGALGKNKLLYRISQYYQTLICVQQSKLKQVQAAGGHTHIFTTNPGQSFIQVISKRSRKQRVEFQKSTDKKFICIHTDFLMLEHQAPDGINFMVPYSVHSNFKQMSTLIKLIKPATLYKLVIPYETFKEIRFNKVVDNRLKLAIYLNKYEKMKKSKAGYSDLVMKYTDLTKLSKEYLGWMYQSRQKQLMGVLKIGKPDHGLRKRQLVFEERDEYAKEKKRSLREIAGELKATHKNQNLVQMMEDRQKKEQEKKQKQKKETFDKIYKGIFQGDDEQTRCQQK